MAKLNDYLIYACEQRYGGLHGIYDYRIEYGITEQKANEIGHEISINIMEAYTCIMEDLQEEARCSVERGTLNDNEYEVLIYEVISELEEENAEWSVYKLRDNLTQEDKEQISALIHRNDWEEIIKQYGEEQSFAIVL